MSGVKHRSLNQSFQKLQILYHHKELVNTNLSDKEVLQQVINDLNDQKEWLRKQPIDSLIGLIGEVSKKWALPGEDLHDLEDNGLGFLANWCTAEHLHRISTFGLRGDRRYMENFLPILDSRKEYLRATQRGLVSHWLAGNVQILGMFALVQAILTKNVNLLKVSSRDDGAFLKLLSYFQGVNFISKGGHAISGDDLLKTISIVYFSHDQDDLGECMSRNANVRIAWGGGEAVGTVTSYPKRYDTEDIIFGPKLSFSVISKEFIDSERKAKKTARKVAVDASIFDQTGCASPHNIFVETGSEISPEMFAEILNGAMQKVSIQIPKGAASVEQLASIHSVRGVYDFKGRVWGSEDLTWTILYDDELILNQPVYSRVLAVHPINHIEDTIKLIDENIQTIGLGAEGRKGFNYAMKATEAGVSRCPELGKMLNFESPWDGIILMDRLVKWSTLGGPVV